MQLSPGAVFCTWCLDARGGGARSPRVGIKTLGSAAQTTATLRFEFVALNIDQLVNVL